MCNFVQNTMKSAILKYSITMHTAQDIVCPLHGRKTIIEVMHWPSALGDTNSDTTSKTTASQLIVSKPKQLNEI